MPKSSNQKLKLPYLMKIMLEKTDENHGLTMQQILDELSQYGVAAERKSIYSDFEPDPSDDVSAAVHGAMLYKRDDEIREMFTNGTISADQPYVERRAVYDRLMHEDDMDMDSESDDDWSSESDEDGDCESE